MDEAGGRERGDSQGAEAVQKIVDNLAQVVHATDETLRLAVLCLIAEGHLIIEDFPGVGKTMLAKGLAPSTDCPLPRLAPPAAEQPPAAHARPPALRRDRRERLQPEDERVRIPPRPGVREPAARRRDQPCLAEDP